jgi:hypothetical protein
LIVSISFNGTCMSTQEIALWILKQDNSSKRMTQSVKNN